MNYTKTILITSLIFLISSFFVFNFAQADEALGGLNKTGSAIGYDTSDTTTNSSDLLAAKIGFGINVVLSMIGVVFIILIWLGALDIAGANGDKEAYKKGKDRIRNGAVGILIIFIAYIFTKAILAIIGGGGATTF